MTQKLNVCDLETYCCVTKDRISLKDGALVINFNFNDIMKENEDKKEINLMQTVLRKCAFLFSHLD